MRRRASFLVLSAADFSTFPSLASPRNYRSKGVYIYNYVHAYSIGKKFCFRKIALNKMQGGGMLPWDIRLFVLSSFDLHLVYGSFS